MLYCVDPSVCDSYNEKGSLACTCESLLGNLMRRSCVQIRSCAGPRRPRNISASVLKHLVASNIYSSFMHHADRWGSERAALYSLPGPALFQKHLQRIRQNVGLCKSEQITSQVSCTLNNALTFDG